MKQQKAGSFLFLVFVLALNLAPEICIGQDSTALMDIRDLFVQKGWVKKKPEKKSFLFVVPVIASNPTAGIIFGGGLTYTYKSDPAGSKLSTITANATYSSKGLLNLNIKSNVFALNDELVLNGDWRFLVNSETTYGLGSMKYPSESIVNVEGYQTSSDTIGQPLKFSQVRIHETISWLLFPNFYAGIGFQFDARFNIHDYTAEGGDSANSFHYQYSKANNFDPVDYIVSGLGLNILFDSRDNQVNAWRGYYGNINYLINKKAFGSSVNSSFLLAEYRSYHPLDNKKRGHLLAFWLYGNFVLDGKAPYLALPAIGNDQRQKTGRGYSFGTFRGEDMLYAECEYRFPLSARTGILGGVLFINAATTSDRNGDVKLLQYIRPGVGLGLRIMLEKKSRTRLQVDFAAGDRQSGFYFGAQETF